MSRKTIRCLSRLAPNNSSHAPPTFLTPALENSTYYLGPTSRPFSTTSSLAKATKTPGNKFTKDNNRQRGVSAIRRSGPRWQLKMQKHPLPRPVEKPETRKLFDKSSAVQKHGLWKFFNNERTAIETPVAHASHGRAWTYAELATKDWNDLYRLWWLCSMERNRIATSECERKRVHAGFGEWEAKSRDDTIKETQAQIKRVLRDRHIAWEDARSMWSAGIQSEDSQFVEEDGVEEIEEEPLEETRSQDDQTSLFPPPQAIPPSDAAAPRPVAQS